MLVRLGDIAFCPLHRAAQVSRFMAVGTTREAAVSDELEVSPEYAAAADLTAYELLKARIKELSAAADVYKKNLLQYVEEEGEEDDKGHIWVTLPDGRSLKKQKSSSTFLDEEFAIDFLEARPELADSCLIWQLTVDDDAVLAARYKKLISDDEMRLLYPSKVTWSFVLPK